MLKYQQRGWQRPYHPHGRQQCHTTHYRHHDHQCQRLAIEGGGLVYVDGSTCVKSNGSVNMTGVAGTGLGSLFIKGCVTVGSGCSDNIPAQPRG